MKLKRVRNVVDPSSSKGERYEKKSVFYSIGTDFDSTEYGNSWACLRNILRKNFGKLERRWHNSWNLLG